MNIDESINEINEELERINLELNNLLKNEHSDFDKGLLIGMRSSLRFTLAVLKSNR